MSDSTNFCFAFHIGEFSAPHVICVDSLELANQVRIYLKPLAAPFKALLRKNACDPILTDMNSEYITYPTNNAKFIACEIINTYHNYTRNESVFAEELSNIMSIGLGYDELYKVVEKYTNENYMHIFSSRHISNTSKKEPIVRESAKKRSK